VKFSTTEGERVMGLGRLLCAALLMVCFSAVAEESLAPPTFTVAQIDAAEASVKSRLPEDDPVRAALLNRYDKARTALQQYQESLQLLEKYRQARDNAPGETALLQAELAALRQGDEPDLAGELQGLTLVEVEQRVQSGRSELSALNDTLAALSEEVDGFTVRAGAIRERVGELVGLQRELETQLALVGEAPAAGGENEARLWVLQAQLAQAAAEKAALEEELLSQPVRLDLHRARLDKTSFDIDLLEKRLAVLEQQAGELRQEKVAEVRAETELVQEEVRDKHPLVQLLAAENSELSEQLAERSERIAVVRERDLLLRKQAEQFEADLQSIKRRLEVMGMTMAIGQILREQSVQLPTRNQGRRAVESLSEGIRDSSSRQIELEDERRKLRNLQQYAEDLLADQPPALAETLLPDILDLAASRRDLVGKSIEIENTYASALGDLEFNLRRQSEAVKRYRAFIAERLLWIPSREPLSIFRGGSLLRQLREMFSPSAWVSELAPLPRELISQPATVLGFALVLLLTYLTPRISARLLATGRHVGFVRTDVYSSTLQALGLSFLLSLKWPLLMQTVAWMFETQEGDTGLAHAVYLSLSRLSVYFWLFELQRRILMPGGLADRHFNWPSQRAAAVYLRVLRLEQIFLPAAFLVLLSNNLYPREVGGAVGALAVATSLVSIAYFFHRFPSFVQERMNSFFTTPRPGRSEVLGKFSRLFLTWVPVLAIGGVAMGYTFTALEFTLLLLRTILLVTVLFLIQELGLRWLRIIRRKMIVKVREELSHPAQEGGVNPEEDVLEHDPELLDYEGTKFLNAMVIIGGALGLFGIWSEVLPAFGILESVELWHQTGVVDGREAIIPVTLADLAYALLVLVLGWLALRRIPGLLDILLRQRVHVSAASAYAATRVFQYAVTTLLVVYVMGVLGGSWSQIQWAVAALSVGIGFGLQEIVANFISGLIILFEQPIRVGDTVTVGDVSGTVTRIRIRATTIRDWDQRELLVPNKEFVTGRLLNWSLSDAVTRLHLKVGVAYGTDMKQALDVVRRAVEEHPVVLRDPEPIITFDDFGDNSLLITVRFYLDGLERRLVTTSELRMAINDRFNELGIVVAFPQRDVHLDASEPIPVRVVDQATERG
jgi:potassium efflux system protein